MDESRKFDFISRIFSESCDAGKVLQFLKRGIFEYIG